MPEAVNPLANDTTKPKPKTKPQRVPFRGKRGQDFHNRFEANGQGRRLVGWCATNTAPEKLTHGTERMRSRAREAAQNEWVTEASTRTLTTNLIGVGILPRPKTKNKALKTRLSELWTEFAKSCDAYGVLDFYGLQTLGVRNLFEAGEFFARIRPRRTEDGLIVPMQIQLLESEMCPYLDVDSHPLLPAGHRLRSGIELDAIGARTAIWFYKAHPDNGELGSADFTRVPISEVMHIFEPTRIGQLRGITGMATTMIKQREISDYLNALLERVKLANMTVGFVKRPPSANMNDPILGSNVDYHGDNDTISLAPATLVQLQEGEDIAWSNPPQVGVSHAEYVRSELSSIAAGNGVPYNLITHDLKDVSDRTLRVVINEFRRWCSQKQWQILIPQFCDKVYKAFVDYALLSGEITQAEYKEALKVQWYPHGFEYIHPVQDVEGQRLAVEAGFKSRDEVISARGDDPEEVDALRSEGFAREKALGITAILQSAATKVKSVPTAMRQWFLNLLDKD